MSKLNLVPIRFESYISMVKAVEHEVAASFQEKLKPLELEKLRALLQAHKALDSILDYEVNEVSIKILIMNGAEYLEKKIGSRPWIVRTPFKVIAQLDVSYG
jgi:hypothetical protein